MSVNFDSLSVTDTESSISDHIGVSSSKMLNVTLRSEQVSGGFYIGRYSDIPGSISAPALFHHVFGVRIESNYSHRMS